MRTKGECSTIHECRVSGSKQVEVVLDFGLQPLANGLIKDPGQPEEFYPLRLGFCPDSSLLQLMETVPKEKLFKNYFWVSGTSETTREYAELFFSRAREALGKPAKARIVEIASNDGTFLKPFKKGGYEVLGIDPAENIAREAEAGGVPTWAEFWNRSIAEKVLKEKGAADLVFARNVIPHVSELHEVIQGMGDVMAEDGLGMIEFHEALKILNELHYDSVYHEHLCYFSLHSMQYLLKQHGLNPFHIEFSPISGGSVVVHFSKQNKRPTAEYEKQLTLEAIRGVNRLETWKDFAEKCRLHRTRTLNILKQAEGQSVVGFGASARSATYINFCGLTKEHLKAVIDNNPRKQGLFNPGSHIPILSMQEGLACHPDLIFVLAWNFSEEIMQECRRHGFTGKFITPFPEEPKVIGA